MEVYLIRHTTPEIEKGICYGQSDIPLAKSFEDEWKVIKRKLPSRIDRIFTSSLSRYHELSSRLSTHFQIPSEKDDRLLEMNFGEWEMKRWDELDQNNLTIWMNDYLRKACPMGESYDDVKLRLKRFIFEKLQDDPSYLIVTHGGIIKGFHGLVTNTHGMDFGIGYGESYHFKGVIPI
jgi:alpha-ribazole phosphatase